MTVTGTVLDEVNRLWWVLLEVLDFGYRFCPIPFLGSCSSFGREF